jgi:23S rRNA pseudouridine2605 synthase
MRNVKKGRVTLDRALSKLGFASRTEAKALILAGKVKVHGVLENNPNRMVNPDVAHIVVVGEKAIKGLTRVFAFYKPKGCLTTKRDPEGRPTIYDHLPPELQSFHAVGRLDQHTSGLLLMTNDTRFSNYLTDPTNEIPRTYLAEVRGRFSEEDRAKAIDGIDDQGERLRAVELTILKAASRESTLEITLCEGKNREIRRMCLALGHEVTALKRTQFGNYSLDELQSGELIEVAALRFSL